LHRTDGALDCLRREPKNLTSGDWRIGLVRWLSVPVFQRGMKKGFFDLVHRAFRAATTLFRIERQIWCGTDVEGLVVHRTVLLFIWPIKTVAFRDGLRRFGGVMDWHCRGSSVPAVKTISPLFFNDYVGVVGAINTLLQHSINTRGTPNINLLLATTSSHPNPPKCHIQ
jgi:hypothetical protein